VSVPFPFPTHSYHFKHVTVILSFISSILIYIFCLITISFVYFNSVWVLHHIDKAQLTICKFQPIRRLHLATRQEVHVFICCVVMDLYGLLVCLVIICCCM